MGRLLSPIIMNDTEFVDWLRGFTEGVHHYNLTPKQWDYLKEKLSEVGKQNSNSYIVDQSYWKTTVA